MGRPVRSADASSVIGQTRVEMNHAFITAGAFCRARRKLLHTAYVELNNDIVGIYYRDDDIKRFNGYRLLAFDASRIILPNTKEIKKEFGVRVIANQRDKTMGEYTSATYEACYDVLNNMAVRSYFGASNVYEADIAGTMLDGLKTDDLLIFDRGYASYLLMALLIKNHHHFVIRCPHSFLIPVRKMFDPAAPDNRTVSIDVPASQRSKASAMGLPDTIKIRLSKIILSTGEVEVLATSLIDADKFSINDLKEIYRLRWTVETFFSKIKG